jgi:hypothetical protein
MTTKPRAPRTRPNLVARPRLREVLSRAERRRLTLVPAPAGFGKTTLLGEWSEDLRRRYPLLEDMRGIKPVPVRRFPPSSRALGPRKPRTRVGACLSERTVAEARDATIFVASYVGGVFAPELASLDAEDLEMRPPAVAFGRHSRSRERRMLLGRRAAGVLAQWSAVRGRQPGKLVLHLDR